MLFKLVKFRYMLVRSTVPNIYISKQLTYNTTTTTFTAGATKNFTFSLTSLANPAPFNFSNPNLVYLHSFTDTEANNTMNSGTKNGQF